MVRAMPLKVFAVISRAFFAPVKHIRGVGGGACHAWSFMGVATGNGISKWGVMARVGWLLYCLLRHAQWEVE